MSESEKHILNDESMESVSGGGPGAAQAEQEGRTFLVVIYRYVPEVGGTRRFDAKCGKCGASSNMYARSVDETAGIFNDVKCYTCGALYPWINANQ